MIGLAGLLILSAWLVAFGATMLILRVLGITDLLATARRSRAPPRI